MTVETRKPIYFLNWILAEPIFTEPFNGTGHPFPCHYRSGDNNGRPTCDAALFRKDIAAHNGSDRQTTLSKRRNEIGSARIRYTSVRPSVDDDDDEKKSHVSFFTVRRDLRCAAYCYFYLPTSLLRLSDVLCRGKPIAIKTSRALRFMRCKLVCRRCLRYELLHLNRFRFIGMIFFFFTIIIDPRVHNVT